jgi:hypothetical protein
MNEYRKQQLQAAALIEQGATAEQIAAVYGWTKSRAAPEQIETGDKKTLTRRAKCGIIKAIRRHVSRKIKMEVSKMDKVKIWSVCVNHVTWSRPQTLYFNSKEAAAECYNNFEHADKPQYIGAYSPQKVVAAISTNPANISPEIVLTYYRSYAEYIACNR